MILISINIRSLQEARDTALVERDKAIASERETEQQLQQLKSLLVYNNVLLCMNCLMDSYHQLQVDHNSQVTELQAVLRVKSVEVERTKVLYEEATHNLLHSESQRDQISKRVEVSSCKVRRLRYL